MARQIVVEIVGDSKKFGSAVDEAVSKSSGLKSKLGGVGKGFMMGVGFGAVGLVTGAIDGLVGTLGDANAAFNEDQAGARMLSKALQNNIPDWNGNEAAINKYIDAQGRLGFSDDEVRASLGKLVGVTHDATKAQNLNSLAQDLARSKGISLEQATNIVTKAYQGNGKALKGLGVDIGSAKTGTEMLDAVMKNANGSAEEYAATNEGKLAASNIKVGEAMEKIGGIVAQVSSVVMPALADAFSGVVDLITSNLPTIQPIVQTVMTGIQTAVEWITLNVLPPLGQAFQWIIDNVLPVVVEQFNFIATNIFPLVAAALDWISKNVIPALGAAFKWFADNVLPAVRKAIQWIIKNVLPVLVKALDWISKNVVPALGAAFKWVVDNVLPPLKSAIGWISDNVLPALGKAFGYIVDTVLPAVGGAIGTAVGIFNGVITTIGDVATTVTTKFGEIVDFIKGVPGKMADSLRKMFAPVGEGFKSVINAVIRGWNSLKFTVPSFNLGPLGSFGGFTIGTPNIPYLHAGGIVPGRPGADVLTILQAGERVIPRSQVGNSSPGVTVVVNGNIYGISGVDELTGMIAKRLRLQGA